MILTGMHPLGNRYSALWYHRVKLVLSDGSSENVLDDEG